jgi:CheY-like chemotaxis protein
VGRILVAEDDTPLRRLLNAALAAAGHDVVVAADGAEALQAAEAVQPELVVTDYVMPILDGVGLIEALWQRDCFRSLPVIMFSAYEPDDKLLPLIQASKVRFVAKGGNLRELLRQVSVLLPAAD